MSGSEKNWPEARARLERYTTPEYIRATVHSADLRAALVRIDALEKEARDYAEAVDNVRAVLGLDATHWMVIHNEVEERIARAEARVRELEAAVAAKDAALREARGAMSEAQAGVEYALKGDALFGDELRALGRELKQAQVNASAALACPRHVAEAASREVAALRRVEGAARALRARIKAVSIQMNGRHVYQLTNGPTTCDVVDPLDAALAAYDRASRAAP